MHHSEETPQPGGQYILSYVLSDLVPPIEVTLVAMTRDFVVVVHKDSVAQAEQAYTRKNVILTPIPVKTPEDIMFDRCMEATVRARSIDGAIRVLIGRGFIPVDKPPKPWN